MNKLLRCSRRQFILAVLLFISVAAESAVVDTTRFYMRHSYDVLKYKLDVNLWQCYLNPYPRTFQAQEVISLRADSALNSIRLNAVNNSIGVDSVKLNGVSFVHANDTLTVNLDRTYQPGEVLDIMIYYRHKNIFDKGFYTYYGVVFTDSPPEGARKWLVCWDRPSDKAMWELNARVPLNVRLGSTGLLVDSTIVADTINYHWKSDLPVSTYLITFTSRVNYLIHKRYWQRISDPGDSVPIWAYYKSGENTNLLDSTIGKATTFYASLFGDYPFEKIGFATLNSIFPWGGMENQTMVNLQPGGYNSEDVMVHEHSHQWFGDLITCGTWADIWLNEGFATYCQNLWVEHSRGYNDYKNSMNGVANSYLASNPGWPLYNGDWAIHTPSSNTLYNSAVSYNKGACVLFQLRYVLGDSLFFRIMHEYATDTALMYKNAVTRDFIAKVNDVSGQDLNWFFNEWVYAPNHPVYDNTYEIDSVDSRTWKVVLIVNQTQTNTVFFRMPLEIAVHFADSTDTLLRVMNDTNHQVYGFLFTKKPESLVFDPSRNILMKEANTAIGISNRTNETGFMLKQNEPNPFIHRTGFSYRVPKAGYVRISITDSRGNVMRCPVNRHHQPGSYHFELSGSDFTPGIYSVTMEAGNFRETKKMVVLTPDQ